MICFFSAPHFYCPSNLDLPAKLTENGEEKWLKRDLWRLYYILTVIYRKRWTTDFDKTTFVEINAKILQTIIGSRKAKRALKVLLKIGVIETDGFYLVALKGRKGKSRGFRFTDQYNFVEFREVKEIDCSKVSKRLFHSEERLTQHLKPEHKYLFDCLKEVTICEEAEIECDPDGVSLMTDFEQDFYQRSFEWVQTKQWQFSVGEISGRVFTNITNLPRELRPYLRIQGKPLIEVDISASQPLLLSQLYQAGEPERDKYLDLVLSGNFYEALDAMLDKPFGADRRDDLKRGVLTQIFFDELRAEKPRLAKVFSELFPVLFSEIEKLKGENYKALSHKLQRDESEIVIMGVVRKIMQTTKIPIITIHDSILTLPEHGAQVAELLGEFVYKKTNVVPKVKTKDYSKHPSQAEILRAEWMEAYLKLPVVPYTEEQLKEIDELLAEEDLEEKANAYAEIAG